MAKIGIVRRFDDLGRVCIPREIREMVFGKSDISQEPVEIFVDGKNIVLKRYIESESEADKEIRAKAIEEFAEAMKKKYPICTNDFGMVINESAHRTIDEIAKELKGE